VSAPVRASSFGWPCAALVWLLGTFVTLGEPLAICDAAAANPPPAWLEVREQTACEAMRDDDCLGRYGFAVEHDGTFVAGPSARGSKVEGRIKRQELRRLGELIGRLSSSLPSGEKTCEPGALPGIKDQVDVTLAGGSVTRAYDLGGSVGKICYPGARDHAHALHEYLRKLMTRYYPVPFPKN
jgi:hypothetical protein